MSDDDHEEDVFLLSECSDSDSDVSMCSDECFNFLIDDPPDRAALKDPLDDDDRQKLGAGAEREGAGPADALVLRACLDVTGDIALQRRAGLQHALQKAAEYLDANGARARAFQEHRKNKYEKSPWSAFEKNKNWFIS